MADKGQSKQQQKDNKHYRPALFKAIGIPKRKKNSSDSQSTPPPPGTDTAEAWTDATELETMFTNDNTPDSERRISDCSQLEQRRNTFDNSSSSRNNPVPVYTVPPFEQQSSTVIQSQPTHTQPHIQPHIPDDVNDGEVTNLQRTLEKTRMERDRINNDKQILERRLSEYEDLLAASRVVHKRPQTGFVTSPDNRISQLESQLQYERIHLNDMRREKEELETEYKTRHQKEIDSLTRRLEEAKSENNRKEATIAELNKCKHIAIKAGEIEKELKETRDRLDKANTDIHFKEKHFETHKADLLGSHKEQEERMKAEKERLQKEKEMTENNLAIFQKDVDELRKEIETLRADVHLKDKTLEEQKEQYGTQLEETRNESERLIRAMKKDLQQQKERYEAQLQQPREEIVIIDNKKAENDGASATSSLSEKDKEAARIAEQLMEREVEVTELKKQLQLMTMEATTLEERKYQLQQELTHMVDGTAVVAERAEIEKEKQDMEAERRHYKRMEAQYVALQGELKQKLLQRTVDKQGSDSVTDLKLQLEEKEIQIQQLSQRSADKTTMCDENHLALEESTQKFEKACIERDDSIAELKKEIEQWKKAGKNTTATLQQAMKAMKIESERIIEEDKKELLELQHRNKEHELVIEELNTKCIRMNEESVKANDHEQELIESAEQTKRELQELQQEHALLGRKMKKILETTDIDETSRELNIKQRLNNQKDKEIKQLKEDLSVAQSQIVIFNEELTKTLKEQKREREVINQLQTELEKNKQVLKKSGKKSFDEMRRSLDEMKRQTLEEERAATQQERTATEQQVRAYKRQVDGLNEQLAEIKEQNKWLQKSVDTKTDVETENIDLQQQINSYQENEQKLLHEKVMRESELVNCDELNKMNKGNKILHVQLQDLRVQYDKTVTDMRNANMTLQQRLRTAWDENERYRNELLTFKDQPSWLLEMGEIMWTAEDPIGAGSYGDVRVAVFRGTRVAAKRLHEIIKSDYNNKKFIREMNISASCHHPNIIQFIGAVNVQYPILLYELMETSLYKLLQTDRLFTQSQIIDIGCNIGSALSYLHLSKPHPIIHRDISSPNVLMESLPNDRWRSKLCDFGSAKLQPHTKTEAPGNMHYAACEAADPNNHSTAMDIYSFAILLMETTLRCPPEGDRKSREKQANTIMWLPMKNLVLQCIAEDRHKRPDITCVLQVFRRLSSQQ